MLDYECFMIMIMLCKSSYARLTPEVLQKASLNKEWAWTHKRSQDKWKEDSDGYECVQFERKGRIGIDQPTQPITPQVFGFHICTTFHEHEHHASIRELISHET